MSHNLYLTAGVLSFDLFQTPTAITVAIMCDLNGRLNGKFRGKKAITKINLYKKWLIGTYGLYYFTKESGFYATEKPRKNKDNAYLFDHLRALNSFVRKNKNKLVVSMS